MNYLNGSRCYLSGPIECQDLYPVDWRSPLHQGLKKRYGITVFDPSIDPKQKLREDIVAAKEAKDFPRLRQIMRQFVRLDLGVVDRCDLLIACLPHRVPTTGTHHEIINSNNSKKPTLLYCPQGIHNIPDWYFGFIDEEFMYETPDALFAYLDRVDRGDEKHNNRWYFLYNQAKLAGCYGGA